MDPTQMQQTVMDSVESGVSFPQETNLSNSQSGPTASSEDRAYEPLNYNEAFPELPNARMNPEEESSALGSTWAKNSDMRIPQSVITHVFHVPQEERAKIESSSQFGESASSRICAEITAKTGALIEISTAKDQSLTFLITGKNEEVKEAKKLALDRFQTQFKQIVKIPKEYHKFILGKKGKKLQDLEAKTGTKIQMPNVNDSSMDIVVHGTKDSTEKAVHEIQLVSDEQSKQAYEKLEIPKMYHPFISTLTNERLAQLVNENNVRINIPPLSIPKDEITIAGEKEGVLECKELINKIYKEMEKKCKTVSVEVPKSQHRLVVGTRGAYITDILQATNVSVEMPPADSPSGTITLRGPQNKLGSALTMVCEKANSITNDTIDAPVWLHKFIIGKSGSSIKQITQDLPKVYVNFEASGISLEGPPEQVEQAKEKLETLIKELQASLRCDELFVDPQYYKHIIGKGGSNFNRIRSENDVIINISAVDGKNVDGKNSDGKNVIRIVGSDLGVQKAKQDLQEMVTKMENEKEREIIIDSRFHRNIIGTKGEKIREIRDRFNQVLISFPDQGGEKSDVVKIRGPKEDVSQCHKYLQKLVKELAESNFQLQVSISRQFHKFIIGKAGANIIKIREETNTRIELPSEGQNSDDITITGRKENCEKAKERILKIQSELANVVEMDIMIPGKFHNAMIGTGGKLIQSISEECGGVSIKFPPPESKSEKVTIRGTKEDVQKAKQTLIELSNEKKLSSHTAEVRAKPELHRFLIGRNGANIRKIRDKTGARIIFPNEKDENKEVITIIGKKEAVEKAEAELKTIIEELDKVVEVTMNVDPMYHRHFVARRGEVLRQISDQFGGVTISFPRQGIASDKVVVKGLKECVDGAVARVKEIATDLKEMVTIDVNIPQKHHRTVMGPRGAKVQGITSEFDVQIKFPDKEAYTGDESLPNGDINQKPQDVVVIQGKKDNCEAARDALLDLVPVSQDIPVSFKYHRFIIGQKGETVRSLMSDHDVNIQVPPPQDQKDSICVTGTAANVEETRLAIEKKVEELLEEEEDRLLRRFQLQMKVDPEYHPKIIGRKGAVIKKIREEHGVNIRFPDRGGAEDAMITISGYEKNCEAARDDILAITGDLESMVRKAVTIDSRIHSRLIGSKGRAIRKIMEEFKVEIKFPRGDDDRDQVVILGVSDSVEECIDHLLNLEEEYIQELNDEEDVKKYTRKSDRGGQGSSSGGKNDGNNGFVVEGAPWTQRAPNVDSSEDFPSMSSVATPSGPQTAFWGPKRN